MIALFCFSLIFAFVSPSDGLVVVGVHSAKFPNEKVSVFTSLYYLYVYLFIFLADC